MPEMIDLRPASEQLTGLLTAIDNSQLALRSPCEQYVVGDLIDHVSGLSVAFTEAATKTGSQSPAPTPSAEHLGADWRTRIPQELAGLVRSWKDPQAWEGTTSVGGGELPASIAAVAALDELIVHGWDIARATGQTFGADERDIQACMQFAQSVPDETRREGGLFTAAVDAPADASPLDQLIAATGRDPHWSAR